MACSRVLCCGLILGVFAFPVRGVQANKPTPQEPEFYDDADGYEVLSLILERETRDSPQKLVRVYYLTDTTVVETFERWHATTNELRVAADDLQKKAKAPQKLQMKFKLSRAYKLVPYQGDDYPIFVSRGTRPPPSAHAQDDKISNGVFRISAIGFDATRTHAIAYEEWVGGMLAGGSFYFLEKNEKGWRITGTPQTWMH